MKRKLEGLAVTSSIMRQLKRSKKLNISRSIKYDKQGSKKFHQNQLETHFHILISQIFYVNSITKLW